MSERTVGTQIEKLLGLERKLVGVKFIFDKRDFDEETAPRVKYKMSYCSMVRMASEGKSFKADLDNFLCVGSAKALGLVKPDARAISGRIYYSFGIYDSLGTARNVQKDVTFLDHEATAVVVKPLEAFENRPDVVLMLVNPYQAMRVTQSYVYYRGTPKNIKIAANSGICSECTATPYDTNDLNVSLLCSNTRYAAKWHDHEMGIGLPYGMLSMIRDGLVKTVNPCEPNERKKDILKRLGDDETAQKIMISSTYFKTSGNDLSGNNTEKLK